MSTHALVGVMHGPKFKAIYVHSDGYPEYVGKVLLKHYDSAKANHLVAMGDCSMLGKEIGEKIDFDARLQYDADRVALQCRFFGRDREDDDIEFEVFHTFDEVVEADYKHVYAMINGVWYYCTDNLTMLLEDALSKGVKNAHTICLPR